jgi:enolase
MTTIEAIDAWEVLDSRGNPTVRARVHTPDGSGTFTVPAGASTGSHEAVEVRDGGDRFGGLGVTEAVEAVEAELEPAVVGRNVTEQAAIDEALLEADGTEDLSRLGANAVLGVSGAVARTAAAVRDEPLYTYLAPEEPGAIPRPMVNILSGGLHAHGGVEIQDFLVVPRGADTYEEAIETVWTVRRAVRDRIEERGVRPLVADEGGFSPPMEGIEEAFELLRAGILDAGFEPATDDVAFAVDVAATHFYDEDAERYRLETDGVSLDREGMIDRVLGWTESYPIVSIEDPLFEDDWAGWRKLAGRLDGVQLLGDDFLVTDRDRLGRAIESGAASAVLVKMNQAGTITRTLGVIERAQEAGLSPVVSARSGETCDSTMADLAVARGAGQLKVGSLARSERLAKYNRLFEIADELGPTLPNASDPV